MPLYKIEPNTTKTPLELICSRIPIVITPFQGENSSKLRKPMISKYGQVANRGQAGAGGHLQRKGFLYLDPSRNGKLGR